MPKKEQNNQFYNDWQALSAKPEAAPTNRRSDDKIEEPYRVKRQGNFMSMFPSEAGEEYSFFIVPGAEGKSFIMEEIMTIQRFKFRNPKTGDDYFETLKIPMDPKVLFDMTVVDKASKNPESLTEEEKVTLKNIKRHATMVKRYKDLYWCKDDNINFKYSPKKSKYNNRLKKEALTGFFGVPTMWKGESNSGADMNMKVKFISTRYMQFQDKFRTLLEQTAKTHDALQPTWYEDYFSSINGVKGIINVSMGSMKVGGKGATVKLIKVGKDPIEDNGVGVTGEIKTENLTTLDGPENSLSHLHYYMGFNSQEDLWQDMYVERFEEALTDLEGHVKEVAAKNATETEDTSSDS